MLAHAEPAPPSPGESAWFRALLENAQDLVTLLSARGEILYASPAALPILGYPPAELAGRLAVELVHPDDLPDAREMLTRAVATPGATAAATHRFRHRDGSWRHLEAVGRNLLHDGTIRGVVMSCRDITGRVLAEEAARAAREEAERASRAKNEFLSRMSHELRTPLNAILGFAQLLELEDLPAGQRESVEQILRGGRHLLQLINEVLEISRIEEGRLSLSIEPVSVRDAAQQSLELVRPLAAECDVRLGASLPSSPERFVSADLHRLRQVLLNLLGNAIKYNRPGGEVALECAEIPTGGVRIAVRDTGIGIPPERMADLFLPFQRLGVERLGIEGTGLGLALSRRLVELMGGTMGVWSEPGRGSTFWVELPAAGAPALPEEAAGGAREADPPAPPARTRTVLYVEDNPGNLRLMERVLARRPGVRLLTATQGVAGVDLARRALPDAVLLDLNLPDVSGAEVLRRLRADPATAAIPVVLITADVTSGRAERLRELGARAQLSKPFDVEHLWSVLEECLGGGEG